MGVFTLQSNRYAPRYVIFTRTVTCDCVSSHVSLTTAGLNATFVATRCTRAYGEVVWGFMRLCTTMRHEVGSVTRASVASYCRAVLWL